MAVSSCSSIMPRKSKQDLVCDHCDKVFGREQEYAAHRRMYHVGENVHTCLVCGKQYSSSLGLRLHTYSHTGEKPYKCERCEKAFASHAALSYHRRTHSVTQQFSCELCGRTFRHKSHLQSHLTKRHLEVRSHQCKTCRMMFYTSKELHAHHKVHVPVEGEERLRGTKAKKAAIPCEVCGKMYTSQTGLNHHLNSHSGNKPYSCDVCGKGYNNSAGLLYHQKTHSGEKSHSCGQCGRGFSSIGGLKIHERTHTGEKPFQCEVCQHCFSSKSNLHAHQRVHTRAWLATHHDVAPRPVSASAVKMRRYRERLKANPSLAPPSLQGKTKWRPKKLETLRRYREKLKALDRLRTLPSNGAFDSERFVHSMLEIGGRSTTQLNVQAAEAELKTLLPHNVVMREELEQPQRDRYCEDRTQRDHFPQRCDHDYYQQQETQDQSQFCKIEGPELNALLPHKVMMREELEQPQRDGYCEGHMQRERFPQLCDHDYYQQQEMQEQTQFCKIKMPEPVSVIPIHDQQQQQQQQQQQLVIFHGYDCNLQSRKLPSPVQRQPSVMWPLKVVHHCSQAGTKIFSL